MEQQDAPNPAHTLFDNFVQAQTCKDVLHNFKELCRHLEVDPCDYQGFYPKLKERLNYWKAKALWVKLDKRAAHPDYQQGQVCAKNKCLVLGAGPCGLRTAIELALLGAQVVLLEKRDSFSRNNVLHLWPYTIHDLRGLAAKKFYGKFCSGSLDHISIRQLQLILLKVALLLGVEVHTGVEYRGLLRPKAQGVTGWRAELQPQGHPAGSFQFDVFISAGGGRFVPEGFKRKELRGKLAIGITANFINRRTAAEAQVAEISGVARIYNQKFFQKLHTETGIDLENIVYYKDDTHYFVMTAKKKSLLNKGVIKQDHSDAEQLLSSANVNQEALLRYAYDAAHFSTEHRLPDLEFALNHAGRPDVAMFDFTCMYRAENASLVKERQGKKLLVGLVGDCLVEPFWPLGTGIARGFLAAFDAAWMVRRWGLGVPHLEVLAERESIYQLLSQTTPENTSKNYSAYSIDPSTRYPNINLSSIKPNQVQHLYDVEDHMDGGRPSKKLKARVSNQRQDSLGGCEDLLSWCQQNTAGYKQVKVEDLTKSWRSGLALCALIHHFRPNLIDFASLDESNAAHNNQLAFDVAERELGIPPIMSGNDMAAQSEPDKLAMVLYLTQFYNIFSERTSTSDPEPLLDSPKPISFTSTRSVVSFLSKLKHNSLQRQKDKLMAAKIEKMLEKEDNAAVAPLSPTQSPGSSELCYFCGQRVYVLERVGAEGKFFHRSCFTCHVCSSTLRLGSYSFSQLTGRFFCMQHSEESQLETNKDTPGTQESAADHSVCIPQLVEDSWEDSSPHFPPETKENGVHGSPEACRLSGHSASQRPGFANEQLEHQGREAHDMPTPEGQSDESPAQLPVPPCTNQKKELETEQEGNGNKRSNCINSSVQQRTDNPPEQRPVPAVRTAHLAVRVRVDSSDDTLDSTATVLPPVPKPRTIPPKTSKVPDLVTTEGKEHRGEGQQGEGSQGEDPRGEEHQGEEPQVEGPEEEGHQSKEHQGEELPGLAGNSSCPSSAPDSRPKQSLRKLQLTEEEKSQLVSLNFNQDSDSETAPFPSSSSSSSSASGPPKPPRTLLTPDGSGGEGHWSSGSSGSFREQTNRRSFRRKEEPAAQAPLPHKVRSKFSPWNLSSPRLGREHRFVGVGSHNEKPVATSQPDVNSSDEGDDDDDIEDEDVFSGDDVMALFDEKFQTVPSDPVEAQKLELLKMRTLERRAKLCEMQRFHKAQSIQRRLEEIEVTFKELEEKGVLLERALRGEAGSGDSTDMINQWIQLVHEKNALVSEESELMVASRQLELEDKQSMLEMELRSYMEMDDSEKSPEQRAEEDRVLHEMLEVVDMRNSLVAFLEEKRLKEINEQLQGVAVLDPKRHGTGGGQVHWA
ncbi:hypothetical protein MATL_G00109460 [Megalops atlanticus]|uniref:Molecule interacting with CasL protein 1 n=1 Tax=Megalops atlanticus TaxID=7932 RepID=A0A9D3T5U2_MEGAT|nr:hypothetical protein MATL_G00109460 [Megalops atlanticus]